MLLFFQTHFSKIFMIPENILPLQKWAHSLRVAINTPVFNSSILFFSMSVIYSTVNIMHTMCQPAQCLPSTHIPLPLTQGVPPPAFFDSGPGDIFVLRLFWTVSLWSKICCAFQMTNPASMQTPFIYPVTDHLMIFVWYAQKNLTWAIPFSFLCWYPMGSE